MAALNAAPPGDLQAYARQAAARAGINPELFAAQIQQESGFNPNAGSPAGAQGIAQIVPRYHPGVDTSDPRASLDYAANLMASLLKQYGGDWEKALVAYNGGGGAVAAYTSGQPYQESQTYVARILGNARPNQQDLGAPAQVAPQPTPSPTARAVPTAMAQSQFGDPELTADEAYAACGPAAAVRFAQAYGRNPTLKEALELARSVGWTPQAGMAGLSSEKALMDKLNIPTRLVSGAQWDQFAAEAQSGNPVTISTPGHYFFADGYNPQSGAFHVGRSGLDLRGGSEWMTPAQMERIMGQVQGGLLADNPSVAAPSTFVADTAAALDSTRRNIEHGFRRESQPTPAPSGLPYRPTGGIPTIDLGFPADPQVRALDRAVEDAPQQAQRPVTMAAGLPPPGPPSGTPFDAVGQALSRALSGLFGGGPPGGDRSRDQQQPDQRDYTYDETQLPTIGGTTADRSREMIDRFRYPFGRDMPSIEQATGLYLEPPRSVQEAADRALADVQRRGLPLPGPRGELAFLQPGRSLRELNPLSKGPEGSALEYALGEVPRALGGLAGAGEDINPLARVAGAAGEGPFRTAGERIANLAREGLDLTRLGRPGQPTTVGLTGEARSAAVPEVFDLAARYLDEAGLPRPAPRVYVNNDVPLQQRIADFYENAVSSPNDPSVRSAYDAFAREAHDQYEFLQRQGYTFEPYGPGTAHPDNPYRSSADMRADIANNKHLWVYTGTDEPHPMLSEQQNWEFRAVHDFFGHAQSGFEFGPRGEENAWLEHMHMFSPEAQKAMTTETRGQNSWVNFGPFGEANRADPTQTQFAAQKAILLPDELRQVTRSQVEGAAAAPHGLAVPRPGYPAGSYAAQVEDVLRRAAQEQGTDRPNLTGDQIRSLPGMQNATITDLDEARAVIEAGLPAMRWYSEFVQQIRNDTGMTINPREAAVLMGRFGGNAGVPSNYHAMLSVFDAMRQVMPDLTGFEHMTPTEIMNTSQFKAVWKRVHDIDSVYAKGIDLAGMMKGYRTGVVEIPTGAKLSSYTQNFLHALSDSYDPFSTQDIWQARLFGSRNIMRRGRVSPDDYAAMTDALESARAGRADALQRWGEIQRQLADNPSFARGQEEEAKAFRAARADAKKALDKAQTQWTRTQQEADRLGYRQGILGPDIGANDPAYQSMHAMTNWIARELNLSPREAQAAGWTAVRTLFTSPEYGRALENRQMSLRQALLLESRRGNRLLNFSPADSIAELYNPPASGQDITGKIRAVAARIRSDGSYDKPPHPSWTAASNMSLEYRGGGAGSRAADVARPAGFGPATELRGMAIQDAPILRVPGALEANLDPETGRIPWLLPEHHVQQAGGNTYVTVVGVGDDAAHVIGQRLGADAFNHASPELPTVGGLYIEGLTPAQEGGVASSLRDLGLPVGRGQDARGNPIPGLRIPVMDPQEFGGTVQRVRSVLGEVGVPSGTMRVYTGVSHDVGPATAEAIGRTRPGVGAAGPSGLPAGNDVLGQLAPTLFRDADEYLARSGVSQPQRPGFLRRLLSETGRAGLPAAEVPNAGAAGRFLTEEAGSIAPSGAMRLAGPAVGAGLTALNTEPDDPNRNLKIAGGALGGLAATSLLGAFAGRRLGGQPPASVLPGGAIGRAATAPTVPPGGLRLGGPGWLRRLTYELTDRNVALNQLRDAYSSALGRRLTAGEDFATQRRLQPGAAAEQWVVDSLGPAIRSVGDHYQSLVDLLTIDSGIEVARTMGARHGPIVGASRMFPGGMQLSDLLAARARLQTELGSQKFRIVENAVQEIGGRHARELRQRLVDAGVFSPAQAAQWDAEYPIWAKTHVLDFWDQHRGSGTGGRIGLSDNAVRAYSEAGTARTRLDPVASMVAETDQVEKMARRNEVFRSLIGVDDDLYRQTGNREFIRRASDNAEYQAMRARGDPVLPPNYSPHQGESLIHGFDNGDRVSYVTRNPMVAQALEAADRNTLPSLARAPASLIRAGATSRNPAFLVGNAMLDIPQYLLQTTSRGGVRGNLGTAAAMGAGAGAAAVSTPEDDPNRTQKIAAGALAGYGLRSAPGINRAFGPNVVGELVAGYADAFRGLGSGRVTGPGLRQYLREGGGFAAQGLFSGGGGRAENATDFVRQLRRNNAFTVNSPADARHLLGDILALGSVEALGQRIEMGPRVAAMRVAERRGLDLPQAVLQGRTVTLDYDTAGRSVKFLNQIIPFLNAGVQGPVQLARLMREHPVSTIGTAAALIGVPALMAEVHNHSTPQMEADYADVPKYIKDNSLVWMLGGEPSVDTEGNRKPNYIAINMRAWAPFMAPARELANRMAGREGMSWGDLAGQIWGAENPVGGGGGISNFATSAIPAPLSTAFQLQQNKDYFRDSTIASARTDRNASALGQAAAPLLTAAFQSMPGQETAVVHPSQVDFTLRDIGSGVANIPIGASNLIAGREPRSNEPANVPGLGGFAGRVVRATGGQRLEDARQEAQLLAPDLRNRLRAEGITYNPSPVQADINRVPLRALEEADYQERANKYIDQAVRSLMDSPGWADASPRQKELALQRRIDRARLRAAHEVLSQMPTEERQARRQQQSSAP